MKDEGFYFIYSVCHCMDRTSYIGTTYHDLHILVTTATCTILYYLHIISTRSYTFYTYQHCIKIKINK